jgi:quercetin dioxygenase-like cupin family protein
MIKTKKLEQTPIMETAHHVDARNLYTSDHVMVSVITLKPGQSLKKHITPVDVVFYVLHGKGVVQIGEETKTVDNNTMIESPKDILHCWYNESDEDLGFMVIKAPKPTKKTVFVS